MYKLVVVAGKLRGEEFELEEGDNVFGRSPEVSFPLNVDGISKSHFSITITGEIAYLKDLESSNGTFVNGKLIKSKTVGNKDKIAVPDLIFQVVFVTEKKKIIKRQIDVEEEVEDFLEPTDVPDQNNHPGPTQP